MDYPFLIIKCQKLNYMFITSFHLHSTFWFLKSSQISHLRTVKEVMIINVDEKSETQRLSYLPKVTKPTKM